MSSQRQVFTNGTIYSMDPKVPNPDWVEVVDGSIASVGRGSAPAGDAFDLEGRVLLPGFHDAHIHPSFSGLNLIQCELHDLGVDKATNVETFQRAVKAYADSHPDAPWILGGGWAMEQVEGGIVRAEWLDAVVPERPVYLVSSEGHAAWVNTKAMELAGIDARTPDPSDGRIERDSDGSPNGTLQEGAAFLVGNIVPPVSNADNKAGILAAQDLMLSLGITSWQDAWVENDAHDAYLELDRSGELVGTAIGSLWWDRDRGMEQLPELIERYGERGKRYRPGSIKFMVDGVCENGTAAMVHPYAGTHDDRGMAFLSREILLDAVPKTMAAGIQPHFHGIGDRAIRDALDAVAAGDPDHARSTRPHIAHVQVVAPDDVRRFAELNVAVNAQSLWACHDDTMVDLTAPRLGTERTRWQFPFRSLIDAGAVFACGSDWAVSTADPFPQMFVAATRRMPEDDRVFQPEQAISLAESLAGFTTGAAWVNHEETRSGSITQGKAADLVVVDGDPLDLDQVLDAKVAATFVGGHLVYNSPA